MCVTSNLLSTVIRQKEAIALLTSQLEQKTHEVEQLNELYGHEYQAGAIADSHTDKSMPF